MYQVIIDSRIGGDSRKPIPYHYIIILNYYLSINYFLLNRPKTM